MFLYRSFQRHLVSNVRAKAASVTALAKKMNAIALQKTPNHVRLNERTKSKVASAEATRLETCGARRPHY